MNIGNIQFRHGLFLAPMAGITDHAFRSVCVACGAEGVTTELVSAKGVYYGDKKSEILAKINNDERPAAIQIFGSEPNIMAHAAKTLSRYNPEYFDINMGCPVPKLVKNGEGSALMRSPDLCERIVYAVANAVSVPVTVKIRKSCDDFDEDSAVKVATACEKGGASAIFVHGRTRSQMYTGVADKTVIARVKSAVTVPVIGNGDINSYESYLAMKQETGCDGVMIGRGAYGSPWVFSQIIAGINGEEYTQPTVAEKKEILLKQFDIVVKEKGMNGIREFRHHLLQYCKGFHGSAKLRKEISLLTTPKSVLDAIDAVFV